MREAERASKMHRDDLGFFRLFTRGFELGNSLVQAGP